jgi:hypothetical protein
MQWEARGGGGIGLFLYLPLGDRWRWVVNASPRPIYPQGRFPLPVAEGWLALWAGLGGCGEEKVCCRTGVQTPNRPAYSKSLNWLHILETVCLADDVRTFSRNVDSHLRTTQCVDCKGCGIELWVFASCVSLVEYCSEKFHEFVYY